MSVTHAATLAEPDFASVFVSLVDSVNRLVTDDYLLHSVSWTRIYNTAGGYFVDLALEYTRIPDEHRNGAAKAPAADRLKLIQLGLLPLDKLKDADK